VERDLTLEEAIRMFRELNELAPQATLALAGGEPTMRKDLRNILEFIKENTTISVEMLTNATLINKNNIDWLCDLVEGFNISMEGSTAEIHDAIRGQGAYKRTIAAVDMLVEKGVPISIRMTYCGQGENEVKKLMHTIYDHGVKSFNFRYVVPVGNASGALISAEQHEKIAKLVWIWGKELNMTVGYSDPFPELLVNDERRKEIEANDKLASGYAVTGCSVAFSLLYINPNGIVQFCPYFPVVVDDLKKTPVKEIWYHNEKFNLFRQSRAFLRGECGSCKYKFACGGCRGAAYASGDYLGSDPRCWRKNINSCNQEKRVTGLVG